ncbi:M23 family metallopeptidase [Croceicoccus naphthovorans]|uniref:M23 family metallopeptidase n=1 Tax=Croceicoccus naphthovorans TaxID=1348774 RepID=UPI000A8C7A13|nr:M23 family metallopeptidase [Croceicoccus naphthovorans]MBB3990937.1 murein DD-endopeptidase MepM/ murein hydrolase activator NlpD [Croceicoccus naphthovorans]
MTTHEQAPVRAKHSFWRDARIVLVTAGVTSLAWALGGVIMMSDVRKTSPSTSAIADTSAETAAAPDAGLTTVALPVEDPGPGAGIAAVGGLRIPVRGVASAELVDSFDDVRAKGRHEAIDIMAPEGTPVVAMAPGRVEKLFVSEAGGNTVYIRSFDGTRMSYYAHLRGYAPGLSEGQTVRAGQTLGTVGSSGNADAEAPHLHFAVMRMTPDEAWWRGTPINPYPLLTGAAAP